MARDHVTLLDGDADPDPAVRIAKYGMPPGYERDYPVQMQVGREVLRAVIEDNLAAMRENLPKMPKKARPDLERYRAQLQAFYDWLERYPAVNVWCSIQPEPTA